jgi:SWI/SNF related-matrix-associated actin-dependent regulator of chromatin subfamily C
VGDVNSLQRVFNFLEHWGIINWIPAKGGAAAPGRTPAAAADAIASAPGGSSAPDALRIGMTAGAARPKHALYEFEPPRSATASADAVALAARRTPLASSAAFACNACGADLSAASRYHCLKLPDYDLCAPHYAEGRFPGGTSSGDFVRMDPAASAGAPLATADATAAAAASMDGSSAARWSDQETLLLLEGLELFGDNWQEIANHVGTKSKPQCLAHFVALPIEDRFLDEMEGRPLSVDAAGGARAVASSATPLLPFEDASNPVMAQVAFLAAVVGPRVAAAAAAAALAALEEEQPVTAGDAAAVAAVTGGAKPETAPADAAAAVPMDTDVAASERPTAASMRACAAASLAAAAVKAKLLADQEARDIQRLVVGVIDTQLRKMELKFRQLEELDEALRREGDAADASRASLAADRVCMAAYKLTIVQAQQQAAAQAAASVQAAQQQALQQAQQQAQQAQQHAQQQQAEQQQHAPEAAAPPAAAPVAAPEAPSAAAATAVGQPAAFLPPLPAAGSAAPPAP